MISNIDEVIGSGLDNPACSQNVVGIATEINKMLNGTWKIFDCCPIFFLIANVEI